jgi:hypothetical protein
MICKKKSLEPHGSKDFFGAGGETRTPDRWKESEQSFVNSAFAQ